MQCARRKDRSLLAIVSKACSIVGRGEKSLLCEPGCELRLGREKKKIKTTKAIRWDKQKQNERCARSAGRQLYIRYIIGAVTPTALGTTYSDVLANHLAVYVR